MITVNLLCRKIKAGTAYSIYLRYYDTAIKKIIGSETLDLEISKNYFSKSKNSLNRILAKDKMPMQFAENILIQRKAEILSSRFSISLIDNPKKKVNVLLEIKKMAEAKGHRTYTAMYNHFERYMNENKKEINEGTVQEFQGFLLSQEKVNGGKLSETSVHHYMKRLQIILNELQLEGIIPKRIKANIIKEDRKVTIYLSVEEIQKIMNLHIERDKYTIVQYAYLFSCFTGLRRSDMFNLKWEDICGNFIRIKIIKTKSHEEIPLPETALYILSLLENKGDNSKVFPFKIHDLSAAFDFIAQATGIDKKIRFHSSRHTFGTVLYESGVDIYTVQKLLTHKSIASTMIYAHIKNADKKKAVDKMPNIKID